MINNVITFNRDIKEEPTDLMSLKELIDKHGYKYGYLYKWSCLEGKIKTYHRGGLRLSEQEVLDFSRQREAKYGGHTKKNVYW